MAGPYCTRAWNGACQYCWIPGTKTEWLQKQQPMCPYDVLESVDYKKGTPPDCKTTKASDLCCLYSKTCSGTDDPNKTTLDPDGLASVIAQRSTADVVTFL